LPFEVQENEIPSKVIKVSYDRQVKAREKNSLSKQAFDELPVKESILSYQTR
jgi:hypothetical protein